MTAIVKYLFYQVKREELYLIKFLLEAYENVCTVSTVDLPRCKIQLTIPADFLDDMLEIIADLQKRFYMVQLGDDDSVSQGNY